MKRFVCAFMTIVICIMSISATASTIHNLYTTSFWVDYGDYDDYLQIYNQLKVGSEELTAKKLAGMGIYDYKSVYDEDGFGVTYTIIHKKPISDSLLTDCIMHRYGFEIRDANGNVLMDDKYLEDAIEYNCDIYTIVDEYGEFDVSMGFVTDENGNSKMAYIPVTDAKRYMLTFNFTDEGKKVFADITEQIAAIPDGYYSVYVNGSFVQKYKSKGRSNNDRLWFITESREKIDSIIKGLEFDGKDLLPKNMNILSSNNSVTVNCSEWAMKNVYFMFTLGLVNLEENLDYTDVITREEFCVYAAHVMDKTMMSTDGEYKFIEDYKSPFADTKSHEVAMLYEKGIINGKSKNVFAPNDTITREEAAAIMCRMLRYMKKQDLTDSTNYSFADDTRISDWAKKDVYTAYVNNIMNGVGQDKFDPLGTYTREQSFATIYRTVMEYNKTMPWYNKS